MRAPTAGARIDTSRTVDVYGPLPSSLFLERHASARILKRSASNSARSSSQTAFSSAVHFAVLSRLMRLLVNAGRASSALRLEHWVSHWVSIIRVLHTGNVSQPGTNYATT